MKTIKQRCPKCEALMTVEETLIYRTTSPLEEDEFETGWLCPRCAYFKPISIK